jgi:mRNA interferase HigB
MKIHLIKKKTIEGDIIANARSRPSLTDFLEKLRYADWEKPADMKYTFKQVHLFICWIGTHSEYTALCNELLQYSVSNY